MPNKFQGQIVSPVWTKFHTNYLRNNSKFYGSGIVSYDKEFEELVNKNDVSGNMPYWEELEEPNFKTMTGNSAEKPEYSGVDSDQDRFVKTGESGGWAFMKLASVLSGEDAEKHIMSQRSKVALKRKEQILLDRLATIFDDAILGSDMTHSVAVDDGAEITAATQLTGDSVVDGVIDRFGDRFDDVSVMAVHSKQYRSLIKERLIEYQEIAGKSLVMPTYLGHRLVVTDKLPKAPVGTGQGFKYTSYVFKPGAIAYAEGTIDEPNIEWLRDPEAGVGSVQYKVLLRTVYLMHVRGIRWIGTPAGAYPTLAELNTPSNWERVYDPKDIGVMRLITN